MTFTCPSCPGETFPGGITALTGHYDTLHNPLLKHLPVVPQLNDWRSRAIEAVKALAATGQEFRIYDVARIAGDPPNHRTAVGLFSTEIAHMGLAHVTHYEKSTRPETRSSACAVWLGGPDPRKAAIAS